MPLIAKTGRNKIRVRVILIAITVVLWWGIFLHLFSVWWMFTGSLKTMVEIYTLPPTLWPKDPNWSIYPKILTSITSGVFPDPVWVYIKNSVIMSGGIMSIQIPISALAAYSLSKLIPARYSRLAFLFLIGTMLLPGQIGLIPQYLIIKNFPFASASTPNIPFTNIPFPSLNLINTYWAVILPSMFSAFSMILFKGFFDSIPSELINAARLDGASELGIFRRIILPLSKPVFAVVTYFTFSGAWNSFMWPLIVLRKSSLHPLSLAIYNAQERILGGYGLVAGHKTAGLTLAQQRELVNLNGVLVLGILESIPVFIMFIIFREYMMKGIKLRGFK